MGAVVLHERGAGETHSRIPRHAQSPYVDRRAGHLPEETAHVMSDIKIDQIKIDLIPLEDLIPHIRIMSRVAFLQVFMDGLVVHHTRLAVLYLVIERARL